MTVPNGENAIGVRGSALMRRGDKGANDGEGMLAGLYRHGLLFLSSRSRMYGVHQ
jgi:hypothetical protein